MLVTDNEALYALFRPFGPNGAGEAYPLRAAAHAEADGAGAELHTPAVSFTVATGETSDGHGAEVMPYSRVGSRLARC